MTASGTSAVVTDTGSEVATDTPSGADPQLPSFPTGTTHAWFLVDSATAAAPLIPDAVAGAGNDLVLSGLPSADYARGAARPCRTRLALDLSYSGGVATLASPQVVGVGGVGVGAHVLISAADEALNTILCVAHDGTANNQVGVAVLGNIIQAFCVGDGDSASTSTAIAVPLGPFVVYASFNGASLNLWINGFLVVSESVGGVAAITQITKVQINENTPMPTGSAYLSASALWLQLGAEIPTSERAFANAMWRL